MQAIDSKIVTTLRTLSIDQVEKANSGHPGFPLGAAPLLHTIWDKFLNYNPANPKWENRDRFVLSAGHGSALLYSMLHLAGFDLSLEDLKQFRQLDSKTPGHPEYGHTAGVEATTGPLGHGFATGVGMAIAESMLAAQYNKPEYEIVDHYTYGIVSDGDLMEGVSSEAASLAGTMGLGKLIYLYDDNRITIEGGTDIAFTENVQQRFEAYGWHTLRVESAEDIEAIAEAIKQAKAINDKPSLILVRTHIGFGSPKQDSASAHGEPLGKEGVSKTKVQLGCDGGDFYVSDEVKRYFADKNVRLMENEAQWNKLFADYKKTYPELADELSQRWAGDFKLANDYCDNLFKDTKSTATREASGVILERISSLLPALCGGSADLGPSNKTYIKGAGDYSKATPQGRNVHFGVREHAMSVIGNGMALHGGLLPYTATFLVFADFLRPGIRLAALMGLHCVFVLTHDSVAVGEDGPTHQPIEQTMSLRMIPGLSVLRPADALETAAAWQIAVSEKQPSALLLTRQKLPVLQEYAEVIKDGVAKGGYVISKEQAGKLDLILIATGSEVALCLEAQKVLLGNKINVRVVSLPCWESFDRQSKDYRASVIPDDVPAMAVEAGVSLGWAKYTKNQDYTVCIDSFGLSGPGGAVYAKLGFTCENILHKAKQITGK